MTRIIGIIADLQAGEIDVASFRGLTAAPMIDRSSEEHRIVVQAAFFRAVIDHQCAGEAGAERRDGSIREIPLIREIGVCF